MNIKSINQNNLQQLQDLLVLDIPETSPRELGFLDVVNQATRETTICNVYRYFLDQELSPKLSRLMLDSLLELIHVAYGETVEKTLELSDYEVLTEQTTQKGRIDIVLESKADKTVIIIEVKIYHGLHNDLVDYWNNYGYDNSQKAGVVLSLNSMSEEQIGNPNFVSISHIEWLSKVSSQLPHDLPIKDFIYFKDFVNNMNHLTHSSEMTEEVQFYLKHAEKINKAIETRQTAIDYVVHHLEKLSQQLNYTLYGTSNEWRNIWDSENKATVYYTIYPEKILAHNSSIEVVLEIYGKAIQHEHELREFIATPLTSKTNDSNAKKHLAHIIYTDIPFNDFQNLGQLLKERIERDFEPTRKRMIEFLESNHAAYNK